MWALFYVIYSIGGFHGSLLSLWRYATVINEGLLRHHDTIHNKWQRNLSHKLNSWLGQGNSYKYKCCIWGLYTLHLIHVLLIVLLVMVNIKHNLEQSVKTEGWYSNIFTLKISLPHDELLIWNNRKTPLIFNVLSQTGQYETESKSLLIYRGQSQLPL